MLQAGRSTLRRRKLESDAVRYCGRGRCHSGGFLLRIMPPSWRPVPACAHDFAAGGPFFAAATTAAGGTVLLCRHDGAASILDFRPRLANRCSRGAILGRNRAVILDFKPRLANRCSRGAILGRNRAVILDFRPRLANRCSQKAKTGAIRAVIPDFRPRLTNRCSQEVKTGAIPPSQGSEALCRGRGMPDGQGLRTA